MLFNRLNEGVNVEDAIRVSLQPYLVNIVQPRLAKEIEDKIHHTYKDQVFVGKDYWIDEQLPLSAIPNVERFTKGPMKQNDVTDLLRFIELTTKHPSTLIEETDILSSGQVLREENVIPYEENNFVDQEQSTESNAILETTQTSNFLQFESDEKEQSTFENSEVNEKFIYAIKYKTGVNNY